MKFIAVRDLRTNPAKVWKDLEKEGELVVTNNGKPFAMLTPIREANFEQDIDLFRQARALSALRGLQADAVRNGTAGMSMEEIEAVIAEARPERKAARR
jgi:antitoxin (DNA-binding transcriptional repressor) of toxin-antitoxin stability system